MLRKAFLALAVVVAPIGATAAVGVVGGGVAGAATPAPTTYTCSQSGTVTFQSPGLSYGGALTKNTVVKTKSATTPTGSGCSGVAMKVIIASATTLCPQTGGVPNAGDPSACLAEKNGVYAIAAKPYYYDTTSSFASNGLTDLQAALQAKPLKTTIDGIKVSLAYGTASEILPGGACGASEVGYSLTGNVLYGSTPITTYADTLCISGDTGTNTTGNFVNDLGASSGGDNSIVISGLVIGGASQLVIGLPNASCTLGGSVTFAKPGLSQGGALTSATSVKSKSSTTPTGTYCSGVAMSTIIPSATTLCPQTGGVPNAGDPSACLAQKNGVYAISTKPYYYDTVSSFASSGTADLAAALQAKPLKTTVNSIPLVLVYGTASQVLPGGACGASAVGFALSGNADVGSVPVGTYSATVCITGDTGTNTTNNFLNDLTAASSDPSVVVATGVIGGSSALNVTFNS